MRIAIGLAALLFVAEGQAQVRATQPRAKPPIYVASKAKPLTPQDCEAFSHQPHPLGRDWLRSVCEDTNFTMGTIYAKGYGMPRPSKAVISLPAHGSADAKTYGLSCMSGLAMRRLKNGWEQLRDRSSNYQRCRDL